MKKFNILAILFFIALNAFAQTYLVQVKPKGSLNWGYANEKGEMIIPAQFGTCLPFSEDGIAVIFNTTKGKYYFINSKGERLKTPNEFYKINNTSGFNPEGFSNGLVAVCIDHKWAYLDKFGKIKIAPKYKMANQFSEGFTTVKFKNKYYVLDTLGNEIEIKEKIKSIKKFSCGRAIFKGQNGLWGFIDTNGKTVVAPKYFGLGYFMQDLAWIRTPEFQVGLVNTKGEEVVSPKYSAVKEFNKGDTITKVKNAYGWRFITTKGAMLNLDFDTKNVGDFSEGLAWVRINDVCGFINTKGEIIIEPAYKVVRDFKNGFAAVEVNGLWGLINTKGEMVVEPKFNAMKDVEYIK